MSFYLAVIAEGKSFRFVENVFEVRQNQKLLHVSLLTASYDLRLLFEYAI